MARPLLLPEKTARAADWSEQTGKKHCCQRTPRWLLVLNDFTDPYHLNLSGIGTLNLKPNPGSFDTISGNCQPTKQMNHQAAHRFIWPFGKFNIENVPQFFLYPPRHAPELSAHLSPRWYAHPHHTHHQSPRQFPQGYPQG